MSSLKPSFIESDSSTDSKGCCSVTFADVTVREFERVVGDQIPSDQGPPLSIGWRYHEEERVPVDTFEYERCRTRSSKLEPLNGKTRQIILHHCFGCTADDIQACMKEVERTKKLRSQTIKRQGKISETMEVAFRRLRRSIGGATTVTTP
jgi:hypothetical protein